MKQIRTLKNTFVILLASLFIWACEPEPLDIDVPQAESKMVVFSQALPDQALVVALSKSFSALSTPNEPEDSTKRDSVNNVFLNQFLVENARVIINGPDFDDTLERVAKGVYVAPFFPYSPGTSYQMSAFDPATGFNISSSTTTLSIVDFDTISGRRGRGDDSLEVTLNYKIDDPSGENYYLLNVYTDSIPESNLFSFNSEEESNFLAFSDREYEPGKLVREDDFYLNSTSDTIVVTLTNISKAYFEYIEARNRSGNSFLSEPISFPSNVMNGYGFFNIHFPSARIVELEN